MTVSDYLLCKNVNLPECFNIVSTVGTSGEVRQVELDLIPALITSHGHGANEWLNASCRLVVGRAEAAPDILVVQDLYLEGEVLFELRQKKTVLRYSASCSRSRDELVGYLEQKAKEPQQVEAMEMDIPKNRVPREENDSEMENKAFYQPLLMQVEQGTELLLIELLNAHRGTVLAKIEMNIADLLKNPAHKQKQTFAMKEVSKGVINARMDLSFKDNGKKGGAAGEAAPAKD
jgi:hypothetical protein